MTQYVINIGALPNDGTGDPLRTAFNEVNLNFNQVWATGLVGSNLQIANNTILTTNTNGNLILNPNGVGVVQANAHVLPDQTRIRNLGSNTQRWNNIYSQYVTVAGDATIAGNLSVTGNIVEVGNIVTDALTIQLGNTTSTANAANGAGITVGANDDLATILFNSTLNAWTLNVGLSTGNLILTDDRIMDLYGPSITNADLISGSTSGLDIVPNGDTNPTILYNTYGNIQLQTSNTGSNVKVFNFTTDGTLIAPGNITAGNVLLSGYVSATGNVRGANLNTVGNVSATGNITGNYILGNGSQLTGLPAGYANANVVAYGESGWAGNIIPSGNAVYSLGNSTNQWSDLYVSNATIYMNNVPISLTAGNVLTVDGANVVTASANGLIDLTDISVTGNVTASANVYGDVGFFNDVNVNNAGTNKILYTDDNRNIYDTSFSYDAGNNSISGTGNITAGYFIGDGSQLTGLTNLGNLAVEGSAIELAPGATESQITVSPNGPVSGWAYLQLPDNGNANVLDTRLHNDAGNIEFGTGDYSTGETSYRWVLDNTGNLTVPGGVNFTGGGITQTINEDFNIQVQDADNDGWGLYQIVNDGAGTNLSSTQLTRDDFRITVDIPGSNYQWSFDQQGRLNLAGNVNGVYGGDTSLYAYDNGSAGSVELKTISYAGDTLGSNVRVTQNNATISTANALYTWTFDNTGALTAPGNISTTANIIGGNILTNGIVSASGNVRGSNLNTNGIVTATGNVIGGNITTAGVVSASGNIFTTNITLSGTGTSVNAASGNILTNQVTGTQFNFLNGLYTASINAGQATANYTLQLPANAGANTQVLTTDGTGLLSWTSPVAPSGSNTYVQFNDNGSFGGSGGLTFNKTDGNLNVNSGFVNAAAVVTSGRIGVGTSLSAAGNITGGNLLTSGLISATGNITGNYILGNGSQLTGLPATYSNSNVATFLASYGSNTISTSGNITAGNLIGNISITGNVTGTSANVSLVAGSYTYTFDNTGNLTIPVGGDLLFSSDSSKFNSAKWTLVETISANLTFGNQAVNTTNNFNYYSTNYNEILCISSSGGGEGGTIVIPVQAVTANSIWNINQQIGFKWSNLSNANVTVVSIGSGPYTAVSFTMYAR